MGKLLYSCSCFLIFLKLISCFVGVRIGNIGMEIMSIALPAALALAADPITSLVDTAFVGHIGKSLETCSCLVITLILKNSVR